MYKRVVLNLCHEKQKLVPLFLFVPSAVFNEVGFAPDILNELETSSFLGEVVLLPCYHE